MNTKTMPWSRLWRDREGGRPCWLIEALFLALACNAVSPLFVVEHPPIQDLPQHLATLKIFRDYGDPKLAFAEYFVFDLGRTQYLSYYLGAYLLSFPLGVVGATRLLIALSILALPYAMRRLLRVLGRREEGAFLVFPLLWNPHLLLGFLNFVAALPLCLWGIALFVERLEREGWKKDLPLAGLALLTFYTHVVPFAFLVLACALLALGDGAWRAPLRLLRRMAPLLPASLAGLLWSLWSPAGVSTRQAAGLGARSETQAHFSPWDLSLQELPTWLVDILPGDREEKVLMLCILAFAFFLVASNYVSEREASSAREDVRPRPLQEARRAMTWLSPLALLLYFVAPASYGWIWPIHARFPLLAALFAIPCLPSGAARLRPLWIACVLVLSSLVFHDLRQAFTRFERDEAQGMEEAMRAIPLGSRSAALIFDRHSAQVRYAPFLHSAAWLQLRRGGVTMFSFADFPQSPIRFREAPRPPAVPPRWEWTPENVDPRRDLTWYDYVLVRGGPGPIATQPDAFRPIFRAGAWSVWRRLGGN